jgi:mRNA turnover protein 4
MAIALGRTEAEEMQPKLHNIAVMLRGNCGLLFTNKKKEEVLE